MRYCLLLLLALGSGLGGRGVVGLGASLLLAVEGRIAARVLKHVGEVALATIVTVEVHSHEGTGATLQRALLPQAGHLARGLIHLVVLENRKLNLLVLGLDLLGLGVSLLLTLLATTQEVDVAAKTTPNVTTRTQES